MLPWVDGVTSDCPLLSLSQKCLYRCCQWTSKESQAPLASLGLVAPLALLASQENQAPESQGSTDSLVLLAPLASPAWARLVPLGSLARLDHQGSQGFGENQGYEETRASGDPQAPLASLALRVLLFLENQALKGCQAPRDSGGNQGSKGNLDPQEIEVSRGIMEWASQGCLGLLGRVVPLGPLAFRAQLVWANQA